MAKVELPPGFQFLPTDDELVLHYLLPRVTNSPLPVQGLIQDCDLYGDKHPWEIFKGQKSEDTAYFFTRRKKKKPKAKVAMRTVGEKVNGGGTWKIQGSTDIKDDKGRIIGKKSSLSYLCKGKCGYETEWGRWTMKEYALDGFLSGSALPDLGDIVLCRLTNHQDNKRKTNQETEFGATSSTVYDQEPPTVQFTAMDMPMDSDVYAPTIDSGIEQEQQQDDLLVQGKNGFAMGDGCDMIREPNMEGHGVLSHEEALNIDPFFCVDDGFGVADFQEQNTQEPDIEHQVPTQEEKEAYDLDYFLGISLDDIEDLPEFNGLADPGGPLFVDGIESIYMPDLQEMQKTDDKKDQSRKRTCVFDQEDDEVQINNKKIRREEEHEEPEDDLEDLPEMNGLADPEGLLYKDGFESIYMPDVQEMRKTDDKKDQSNRLVSLIKKMLQEEEEAEDDEVQINNKNRKEEEDEEAKDDGFGYWPDDQGMEQQDDMKGLSRKRTCDFY